MVEVLDQAVRSGRYERDSWKTVPDAHRRYIAALMRHLSAMLKGERFDIDSGKLHAAHLAVNAMFLLHFALEEWNEEQILGVSPDPLSPPGSDPSSSPGRS
jgi:hypothetical protein